MRRALDANHDLRPARRPDITANDPLDFPSGTVIEGRYRLEALLGRGGFSAVYRATQLPVGRPVALKLLLPELAKEPLEVRRFEQEAKIIAALDHPHIVRLIELGQTEEGHLFLAMEHLHGQTLAAIAAAEGALATHRVKLLGEQILDALAEAHDAGVVHRDLKLENLFVTRHPRRGEVVKLLDFGIAKIPESNEVLTKKGMLIGSPKTMAPEQVLKLAVTPRTDLYAFGCIMYELLAGRAPFSRGTRYAILAAQVNDRPPPITVDGRPLVGGLVDLVHHCLVKNPDHRPESAHALLIDWRHASLPGFAPEDDQARDPESHDPTPLHAQDGEPRPTRSTLRLTPPKPRRR